MTDSTHEGATWLLRTDADHEIGLGHLHRMMALAHSASGRGITVRVALKHQSRQARQLLADAGFETLTIDPSFSLDQEQRWLVKIIRSDQTQAIVWDFSHDRTPPGEEDLARYFTAFSHDVVTCVVDGMGEHSLAAAVGSPSWLDVLVIPYVGVTVDTNPLAERVLIGPNFTIVAEEMRLCLEGRTRKPEDAPRHLLVTAGGADPRGITELVLNSIIDTPLMRQLETTVVVGPLFGGTRTRDLRRLCTGRAGLTMLEAPSNLCEALSWADLAVSATGLTKYELALFGIPAVFISGDAEHHQVHQPFSQLGTGIDLGVMGPSTGEELLASLERLVRQPELRMRLAVRGRKLVDGAGADRVVSVILSAAEGGERRARE